VKYETTKEALAAIYKEFGADVLLGKINAHLSDFAPSVPENYKKLAYAVHTFGASKVLKDNLNETQENKEAAVKVAVRCLTDAFISKKIAEDVIFEFVDALGWKVSRQKITPEPKPVTPSKPEPKIIPVQQKQVTPQPSPKPVTPQPSQKPVPQYTPTPQYTPPPRYTPPRRKPSFSLPSFLRGVFTIVDFDSGDGSEVFIGSIGGAIGAGIGFITGGFLGPLIGAVLGYIIFSVFIGKRIHVNIGKVIIIIIVVLIILSIILTTIFGITGLINSRTKETAVTESLSGRPAASAVTGSVNNNITALSAGWRTNVDAADAELINNTSAGISFAEETVDNRQVNVMNLQVTLASGTEWRIGEVFLENDTYIRQIRNGRGVRFSVLGDGEDGWRIMFPMRETAGDSCWHEAAFTAPKGQITKIDIPYSRLAQPNWGTQVSFNRNSVTSISIQRHSTDKNLSGVSEIKIFDFEIY